jgi:hypothetical protein
LKTFKIESTDITPLVVFDPSENQFEISGRSIPADAYSLYSGVHNWIRDYLEKNKEGIVLNMNLEYFNTASHKYIAELFKLIKELAPKSTVNWYYHIDDDEMKQVGEIFDRIFDIKFNHVSFVDD